jgi:putative transcriptional regulator
VSERSKKVASKIVSSVKALTAALERGDNIAEVFTCRKITLDLKPFKYGPEHVKAARRVLRVSQAVFAQFLGVETCTVQSWEQGRQEPSDIACRFMDEIQYDGDYWRRRLRDLIQVRAVC